MKIKIEQSKLAECLKKVQAAANAKMVNGLCGNVKIVAKHGRVSFTTTNLDIVLHCETECEVNDEGAILIPMSRFMSSVAVLPAGMVDIDERGDRIYIKDGTSAFTFQKQNVESFPTYDESAGELSFTVAASTLRDLIKKTSYAQSQDSTRRTLSGVFTVVKGKKIRCVATDGRRLAISENEIESGDDNISTSFIIPFASVAVLQKFVDTDGNIEISMHKEKVRFAVDGYQFLTKLIEGVYPNYAQVIPSATKVTATLSRDDLMNVMNRVSVIASTEETAVAMTFSNNLLKVSVIDETGAATDEIPIKYDGEAIEISFNPKYVLDPVKTASSDDITISLTNGRQPAVFKGVGEHFLCVLMPLRIS